MRRVVILAVTVAVVATLAGAPAQSALASQATRRAGGAAGPAVDTVPGVGTVTWGPCADPTLIDFGAECAMLSVPLDYARPAGPKIQLAISRVRHTVPDDQAQGIMLINPGGPGGSGLIFSIFGNFVPDGAGGAYDWIGFDPRGVGSSVPALSCVPDYFVGPRPPYQPRTRAIETTWLTRATGYAAACGRSGGALLDHVKTTDNAQDMNAIRSALGQAQLNYYGFSYGTYLGQVFATMFPTRVRRMVLDANVDPRRVWHDANLDQDFSFQRVIRIFFDWVARHDATYHLGTTAKAVERQYNAVRDSLARSPRGSLGAAEWDDAVLLAGYVQAAWPDVADAFAALVNNDDPAAATALYENVDGPGDDNGYAMYLGTECTDATWPRNWSVWRVENTIINLAAPFLTWGNAWFNAPCAFWPARSSVPLNVVGKGLPPFLLFGETIDGATPFTGSLEVRRRFGSASLIATVGGTTHANTLAGNPCVDEPIATYLLTGATPPRLRGDRADVLCDPAPEPEPAAAGVAAASGAAGSSRAAARLALQRALVPAASR